MKFKWNIRKKEIDYFGHISKEELDEFINIFNKVYEEVKNGEV